MPKKKTQPGRGQGKNKKKHKYKPLPDEGAKKDEEERTRVNDKEDQDEGSSSSDTASGDEKSSVDDHINSILSHILWWRLKFILWLNSIWSSSSSSGISMNRKKKLQMNCQFDSSLAVQIC